MRGVHTPAYYLEIRVCVYVCVCGGGVHKLHI